MFQAGDGFVYYSPKTSYPSGEPCQMFTAISGVKSGEFCQAAMGKSFHPFPVDVHFLKAQAAAIQPLLKPFSFIKNKTHRSEAFRFGSLKIPTEDFKIIAEAMDCDFES